ncbi:hypothetical protein KCP78_01670 [Salmonella enterica subsp. enterica]|nr:hypothetical protein KCP78_01670 [Salmonella enterica subsp. enterica]
MREHGGYCTALSKAQDRHPNQCRKGAHRASVYARRIHTDIKDTRSFTYAFFRFYASLLIKTRRAMGTVTANTVFAANAALRVCTTTPSHVWYRLRPDEAATQAGCSQWLQATVKRPLFWIDVFYPTDKQ